MSYSAPSDRVIMNPGESRAECKLRWSGMYQSTGMMPLNLFQFCILVESDKTGGKAMNSDVQFQLHFFLFFLTRPQHV